MITKYAIILLVIGLIDKVENTTSPDGYNFFHVKLT